MVVIEMENGGKIEIELYPETAPITVKNFDFHMIYLSGMLICWFCRGRRHRP